MCCVCDGKFVSSHRLKSHLKESHPGLDQEQAFTDCINNSYYLVQPGGGMWGNEEREDAERGMKEEQSVKHKGEDNRREEDRINGVGEEVWQDGEEEQPEVGDREREEAKSQDESTEVQVIEGETGKGEIHNGDALESSQEVIQQVVSIETTTFSDRQDEATAGEKSHDNNSCAHAAENICRHKENPHISISSENANSSDMRAPVPSSPPAEQEHTPHSEKVNSRQILFFFKTKSFNNNTG